MSCPGSSGSPTPKKDRTPTPGSSSAVVRKMLSSGLRPIGHHHQEGPVLGRETHLQLSLGFPNGILGSRLASGAEPDHGASGAPAGPRSRTMAAPPVWRTVSWRSRGTRSMVSVSSTWCQMYPSGVDLRPARWLARAASILRLPVMSGMSTLPTAYGLKSGNPSFVNATPLGYLFPRSPDRWYTCPAYELLIGLRPPTFRMTSSETTSSRTSETFLASPKFSAARPTLRTSVAASARSSALLATVPARPAAPAPPDSTVSTRPGAAWPIQQSAPSCSRVSSPIIILPPSIGFVTSHQVPFPRLDQLSPKLSPKGLTRLPRRLPVSFTSSTPHSIS